MASIFLRGKRGRMALMAIAICTLVALPRPAVCQSADESFRSRAVSTLEEFHNRKKWDAQAAQQTESNLRKLATDCIVARLNAQPAVRPQAFERQLNDDLAFAIGRKSPEELHHDWGFVPKFASVVTSADRKIWVVGYFFPLYNDLSEDVIQAFVKGPDGYQLADEAPDELGPNGYTLSLLQLSSTTPSDARFLTYGRKASSGHRDLKITLYSFTAGHIKALWREGPVTQGEVSLQDKGFAVYWFDDSRRGPSDRDKPFTYKREIYSQTSTGAKLERVEHGPVK